MDISSMTSFANQYALDSVSATKTEDTLKSDYSNATSEELMEACKEFEQYFVEQIFKQMRKTIPQSEMTSSYSSTLKDYVEDSLYQEYAKAVTEQGEGVGLAKTLYEQMKRNYNIED
ncbi:MAG: rod-binding protein [Lachnospiraceae bacterium]|nr:rod-binding protein [Lachnospiraceae bacterium]